MRGGGGEVLRNFPTPTRSWIGELLIAALFWFTAAFGYVTRLRPQNRIADVGTTTIGDQRARESSSS